MDAQSRLALGPGTAAEGRARQALALGRPPAGRAAVPRFVRSRHRIRDKIVICLVCVNSRRFTDPRLEFHIRFVPCAIILGGRGYGRFA